LADVKAIRLGLGALLRQVYPAEPAGSDLRGNVSAYFKDAPTPPTLQVIGVERMVPIDFARGGDWTWLIEGYFGTITDQGAQSRLDELLATDAVWEAVESDNNSIGALYSRLQQNGTVTTDNDPAADEVSFLEYRGSSRIERGGADALVGTWAVRVLT
jgi:hypothetical protein